MILFFLCLLNDDKIELLCTCFYLSHLHTCNISNCFRTSPFSIELACVPPKMKFALHIHSLISEQSIEYILVCPLTLVNFFGSLVLLFSKQKLYHANRVTLSFY
jgi:hypothetical protein